MKILLNVYSDKYGYAILNLTHGLALEFIDRIDKVNDFMSQENARCAKAIEVIYIDYSINFIKNNKKLKNIELKSKEILIDETIINSLDSSINIDSSDYIDVDYVNLIVNKDSVCWRALTKNTKVHIETFSLKLNDIKNICKYLNK